MKNVLSINHQIKGIDYLDRKLLLNFQFNIFFEMKGNFEICFIKLKSLINVLINFILKEKRKHLQIINNFDINIFFKFIKKIAYCILI